jgi:uncharacterized SAM-binding protein YcdF (DUF218 family)
MFPDGTLNNASFRRTVEAVQLRRRDLVHFLVLLGADKQAGLTEAEARANLAKSLGVADGDILIDSRGMTTQEEAERSRDLLFPRGIHAIVLITNSQHMTRSVDVFRNAGFEVHPAIADDFAFPAEDDDDRLDLLSHVASEYIARRYHAIVDPARR